MRCLCLNSLLLFLVCTSFKIKPEIPNLGFQDEKYRAAVDILNKHLSGIVVIKKLDVHEYRVVFLNEMGVTFFDYSFFEKEYKVNQIMSSLNKRAVRETLAKDFGMLLGESIFRKESIERKDSLIHVPLKKKGHVEYTLTERKVKRIANYGKKIVVDILPFYKEDYLAPDSVFIQHHTVNFTIQLKRIDDAE